MYDILFTPFKIGKLEIKNRIVMSPMLMGFGQFDGTPTEELMDYYEERAKGGTGLIITEITRVNDVHGAAAFAQLAMSHDYHIAPMAEFAERIHKHGAKLCVQLHHPGRQNVGLAVHTIPLSIKLQRVWKGYRKTVYKLVPKVKDFLLGHNIVPHSVSASACEPSFFAGGKVRALSHKEVKELIQQFIDAAVRCKKAGVDCVELHGTHGYLIQQFLSPNTNHRTDEYGGSFENRLRFIKEIIEGIKKECGEDYPIIVRLTIDEFYDKIGKPGKGYTVKEGVEYAKAIESYGADAIDVSSAAYDTFNYWLEPTSFDCGWRRYLAEAVRKEVKIPLLAADLIRSPELAEQLIKENVQDFVSLGRPHIADPHWAEKVQSGHPEDVKRCICCLYCIQSMQDNAFLGSHGFCSVNPTVGSEREYFTEGLKKDGNDRVVVIVGAGAGGLTAGEILARRGFKPVILEKEADVGGQLTLAAMPPHKEKIAWCCEDLKTACLKNGVEIKFNTEATPEIIASYNPYAVIIATGGSAIKPRAIKGVEKENVYTTTDILTGKVTLKGKKIALIGSGMTGLETAELLAEDNELTIVEMASSVAPTTWFQHKLDCLPKLEANGTKFVCSHKLEEIDDTGIVVSPVEIKKGKIKVTGASEHIDADAIILSLGSRPVNNLMKELEGKYEKLYCIGDATKIGRIADATSAAYKLCKDLD